MATENGIIDQIRRSLNEGATLADVDSTDDQLVLALRNGEGINRFRLDAEAVRSLRDADLLDVLSKPKTPAKTVLP